MKITRATAITWGFLMHEASREVNGKTWYALAKMGKDLSKINAETEELRTDLITKLSKDGKLPKSKEDEAIKGLNELIGTEVEFAPHIIEAKDLQDFPNKEVEFEFYGKALKFNLKDFQRDLLNSDIIV